MLKPATLDEAVALARLQEGGFNNLLAKARTQSHQKTNSFTSTTNLTQKPYSTINTNSQKNTTNPPLSYSPYSKQFTSPTPNPTTAKPEIKIANTISKNSNTNAILPIKQLTPTEMQAKRDKGLCYNCDEPYFFGHKCKKMQVYVKIWEEDMGKEEIEHSVEDATTDNPSMSVPEPGISLHALSGHIPFQTLVLQGQSKKIPISILVNLGSTHNLLDPRIAKQVGCHLLPTNNMMVTVADGSKVCSKAICPQFAWSVDGEQFVADMRILPLGGYHMILEV